MFALPPSVRVYLASEPVDMRRGHDGLFAIVKSWGLDPFSGHLFAFVGKRRDRVKILVWHRGGFLLLYKRLERGRFRIPRIDASSQTAELDATDLMMLLDGIDVQHVRRPALWNPPAKIAVG
jgi:transposase